MNPTGTITAALLPVAGVTALADLRGRADVRLVRADDRLWIEWSPGEEGVLQRLLPVAGAQFFEKRDEIWYPFGGRLPAADVPPGGSAETLVRLLTPAAMQPLPPDHPKWQPVRFRLVRSERAQPATALFGRFRALVEWADSVPSARIAELKAARHGESILIRGAKLPPLVGAVRLWGETVLLPLGWRLEPDLPPSAIRQALAIEDHELLLWIDGPEAIPADRLQPLSRAAIRLAEEEKTLPSPLGGKGQG